MQLRGLDIFAAAATLLFLVFAAVMHHDMWVDAGGPASRAEFFVYACLAAIAIWVGWLYLRQYPLPAWALVAVAAALALHFVAGFVSLDGRRLYDLIIFGIRFDKVVHFVNAAITARVVAELVRIDGGSLGRLYRPLIVLVVLGVGSGVEMIEYSVARLIPDAGVGFYHNTMQDLIANLCGATVSMFFLPFGRRSPESSHLTGGGGA